MTNEKYFPYVIEPAAGLTRSLMAFLIEAYDEDEAPNTKGGVNKRTVLRLDPHLAPVKVAVLPLSKSAELLPMAEKIADELRRYWNVDYDVTQAIGKRYRRQDEIGTRWPSRSTSTRSRTRRSPSGTATRWNRSASRSTSS